jgi:hypothetical protein
MLLQPSSHARNLLLRVVLGIHQLDNRQAQEALQLGPREIRHNPGKRLLAARQFRVTKHRQLLVDLSCSM